MKRTGRWLRGALLAVGVLATAGSIGALANYAATVGVGTTFGSIIIGGVHFVSSLLCDATTANQCAAVSAGGAVKVDASATTQPVSSATLSTAANQATEISSLATIATNTGAPAAPATSTASTLTGVTCGSAASSCVLKNAAGNLFGVYAECTSACWLMVFNAASAPSNGATTAGVAATNLVECVDIGANGSKSINYPIFPVNYTTGITAVISSTSCATLTLSTVGFIRGTVM
jgi:hypothetical protein